MSLRFLICMACSMVLGLVAGCEPPEDDRAGDRDADAHIAPDTSSLSQCSRPEDILRYYFVRINDLSDNISGANPGADIDAVSLSKNNFDSIFYATKVHEYEPINSDKISELSRNSENMLGEPTAFGTPFNPGNAGPDQECSLDDKHFTSLGGLGGYIIVSFGNEAIEEGDVITVYEVGNCNGAGTIDPLDVQVSVSGAVDGEWVSVFDAQAGPVMVGEVAFLPVYTSSGFPLCDQ